MAVSTVSTGNVITASYYNSLQKMISDILGPSGYNQSLVSVPVSSSTMIIADHWNKLKVDVNACLVWQIGIAYTDAVLPTMVSGGLIYASNVNLYTVAVNDVYSNYYEQLVLTNGIFTHTRTTAWNTTIDCEINIEFATVAKANAFFANSGDLRLNLSQITRNNIIDDVWQNQLSSCGTVIFNNIATTNTGSIGIVSKTGWSNLTSTYKVIFDASNITSTFTNYTSDSILMYMKKNAANTGVIMKLVLSTGHTESIAGGTQAIFGYMKKVDTPSPVYSVFSGNSFN